MTRIYRILALTTVALVVGIFASQAQQVLPSDEGLTNKETTMTKVTDCKSTISNADGKDGTDNNGPDSGNGAKGGTIKNPCKANRNVSANGGNGGNGNSGRKSGNGGAGGKIEF